MSDVKRTAEEIVTALDDAISCRKCPCSEYCRKEYRETDFTCKAMLEKWLRKEL